MYERVILILYPLSFFISLMSVMLSSYFPYLSLPSSNAIQSWIEEKQNLVSQNSELNTLLIFGDFITALKVLANILTGADLAGIISLMANIPYLNYFIQGIYYLSGVFLFIKIISNRIL